MTEYFGGETVVIDGDVRARADVDDTIEVDEVLDYDLGSERRLRTATQPRAARQLANRVMAAVRTDEPQRARDWRECQFKDN